MKDYRTIWLDLDGTLVDSQIGITRGVQLALQQFGIAVKDPASLRCFIGPPLTDSLREFYHFSLQQAQQAVEYYRAYYRREGVWKNTLYPGVKDFLRRMDEQGRALFVASSKPQEMVEQILDQHSIAGYFTGIYGASLDMSRSTKVQVLSYGLARHPQVDPGAALMVGDRKFDVLGAAQVGMDCVGVLYGFGDEAELRQAGAVAVVKDLEQLAELLGTP